MKLKRYLAGLTAIWALATAPVSAVPILQLYVEGATYDDATDTWVGEFSSSAPIRLWAIGNVAGEGGKGTISNVRLSVAYDLADAYSPSTALGAQSMISITGSQTNGFMGFTDPSTAANPTWLQQRTDGSVPVLTGGKLLPSHGEYGPNTAWTEYGLGDFTLSDSPGGDFISNVPIAVGSGYQINVYEILVTGTDRVHFDLYDGVQAGNKIKAVFAPFSHDAESGDVKVPDGGATAALLGLGLVGVGIATRRFKMA